MTGHCGGPAFFETEKDSCNSLRVRGVGAPVTQKFCPTKGKEKMGKCYAGIMWHLVRDKQC